MDTQFYDKVNEYTTLEYPNKCIEFKTYQPKQKDITYYKVFFDFETLTEKTHKPYLVRYETEDDIKGEFYGVNCAVDMLNN